MISIFYGDDRVKADQAIKKILGAEYEVIEGAELEANDLPSIFLGNSLFSEKRKILIRDLTTNKHVSEKIPDYLNSPHDIIIFEQKVSKNSVFYKSLQKKVEFKEFKLPEISLYRETLNIYNTAKKDGRKAIKMLDEIKKHEDPIGFTSMMISIVLKEFASHQGTKEKRVLKELSKLDIEMKTTSFSQWTLLSAFLLQLSSWQ